MPEEYEEFSKLLQSYNHAQQRTVLERMIKANHPALNGSNKPKMEKVFTFLMQYINDVVSSIDGLPLLNYLTPVVFDLSQLISSDSVSSIVLDVLMEKREELSRQNKKSPVPLSTVIDHLCKCLFFTHFTSIPINRCPQVVFLKLAELIFPASDFRHPVTTPAFHLLLEALAYPVISHQAVQLGLSLCCIAYEVFLNF